MSATRARTEPKPSDEERVLVLAPTGRDGDVLCGALRAAGIEAIGCGDAHELCRGIDEGAGAAVVAEEALSPETRRRLVETLCTQPAWSELPLLIMGMEGVEAGPGRRLLEELEGTASAILLRRPVHQLALLSVVRTHLAARARQYQMRDELERRAATERALRDSERALLELADELEHRVHERTRELARRAGQLRRLTFELSRTEQRERKKLAQTLHDGLQQLLVGIKMKLTSEDAAGSGDRQSLLDLVDDSIATARHLAYELSPPILHRAELGVALAWLAERFSDRYGFEVRLEIAPDLPPLGDDTKLLLFPAVQELLFNAVKHSGCRGATLRLDQGDGRVRVEVEDDGAGFDPESESWTSTEGLGLFALRERLEAAGGRLELDSAPGRGARFRLDLPLAQAESEASAERPAFPVSGADVAAGATDRAGATRRIRVLVVDDHRIFREGLLAMLATCLDLELVGEAADGVEAIEQADRLRPDVVIMDVDMPRLDGIEATRRLKERRPGITVVGLSVTEDVQQVDAMLRAGASAYVFKSNAARDLVPSIRSVATAHSASDSPPRLAT